MDEAHLAAWLHCLTASDVLEKDLRPQGRKSLSELLDLPASYGGAGLQSLEVAADEELLGSFASVATTLISFCRNTDTQAYMRIADALEKTDDPDMNAGGATVVGIKQAYERTEPLREHVSMEETRTATELVKGTRQVEVPGAYDPAKMDPEPEPLTLPEPRLLSDYVTAPCKHECGVFKQIRHAKQAHRVLMSFYSTKQSLLRATA